MIKVNAAQRLKASNQEAVIAACHYLAQYTYQSANIADRFLQNKFVASHLKPLYDLVPKPKPLSGLYHLAPAKHKVPLGKAFTIPARSKVVSWTEFAKPSDWQELAEQVGLDGMDYVYAVKAEQMLAPYTSPDWLRKVQKAVHGLKIKDRKVLEFLELDPSWQKEYICDGSKSIRVTSVHAVMEEA